MDPEIHELQTTSMTLHKAVSWDVCYDICGSEKRNCSLRFELQSLRVIEKRSNFKMYILKLRDRR